MSAWKHRDPFAPSKYATNLGSKTAKNAMASSDTQSIVGGVPEKSTTQTTRSGNDNGTNSTRTASHTKSERRTNFAKAHARDADGTKPDATSTA
jgi:hypothetical protein